MVTVRLVYVSKKRSGRCSDTTAFCVEVLSKGRG